MKPEIIIAICALVISLASFGFSIYFGWCTRDHNRRTVRPLVYVSPSDYEDLLAVRLWNYGNGPLIIKNITIRNKDGNSSDNLVNLLPPLPKGLYFSNYVRVCPGRAIPHGDSLNFFEFTVDLTNAQAIIYRDKLRHALGYLNLDIEYTDIYESKFHNYNRKLEWFHRHDNENG